MVYGDEVIKGVPGTGSRIDMYFENPGGAVSGKLFPTGNRKDIFDVPDYGKVEITLIDCANPVVFIKAEDLGIKGTELTELNSDKNTMEHIERIRGMAAQAMGLVDNWEEARRTSTSAPKVAIISKPQDYKDMDGNMVKAEDMELCCRAISVGSLHKAYPMTVGIATASAARVKDTIVNDILKPREDKDVLIIGHSSGLLNVDVKMDGDEVVKGGVTRTARRIMDGRVYVRD
jgi:2-methylaconitate cis-trans-isomerase PrpF